MDNSGSLFSVPTIEVYALAELLARHAGGCGTERQCWRLLCGVGCVREVGWAPGTGPLRVL